MEKTTNSDEITPKELLTKIKDGFRYLVSKWLLLLVAGLLGGLIGLTYSIYRKPEYTAELTFVLEEGENAGGLGQYAGIASMVGIDLSGGGGGLFKGDNILELYKSRSMIEKTLLSHMDIGGKKVKIIDRYLDFDNYRDRWKSDPDLRDIKFEDSARFNIRQDSVVTLIVKEINREHMIVNKPDKKLNIIQVQFKSKDELLAKAFTEQIVSNVNQFYIKTKTKKSIENLAVLQKQTDSVRRELNSAISGVAVSMDANPNANPARQVLRVPSQRRQIDAEANKAILTELVKNLEVSKVSLRKETPLIQVIDEPVLPLEKDRVGKFKGVIFGVILSLFFTIIILCLKKLVKA